MVPNNLKGVVLFGVGYFLLGICCFYIIGRFQSKILEMQIHLDLAEQQLQKYADLIRPEEQLKFYSTFQGQREFRQKRYVTDFVISEQLKWLNEGFTSLRNEINDVNTKVSQLGKILEVQGNRLNESEAALSFLDRKSIEYIQSSLVQHKINLKTKARFNFLEKQLDDFNTTTSVNAKLQTEATSKIESKLNLAEETLLQRQSNLSEEIRKLEIFKSAVNNAVDLGKAMYDAVFRNDLQTVIVLGEMKVNTEYEDKAGNRPLHQAVRFSHTQILEVLIRAGALVDSISQNSYTSLHWAAIVGCHKCAMLLLVSGAKVDSRDQYGNTPLMMTSAEGYKDMVSFLIHAGAAINTPNESGYAAAEYAIMNGKYDCLQVLIDNGADVKSTGKERLMHLAVESECLECVRILIKHGSNINARNEEEQTPLEVAMDLKLEEIVSTLKESGASI